MSNDEIEEMVRDSIDLHAVDEQARATAQSWLSKVIGCTAALVELGLVREDQLEVITDECCAEAARG